MLQQLDGQINAKESFLYDQRNKLSEKDKVISTQRSELERLEKKSKTLEYKVQFRFTFIFSPPFSVPFFFCTNIFSSHSPGRHPAEDDKHVRAGQTIPSAGAGDAAAAAAEGAVGEEAHGAAHAGHGVGHQTQVGEGVCKST